MKSKQTLTNPPFNGLGLAESLLRSYRSATRKFFSLMLEIVWSKLDLAIRIFLGGVFFTSGALKLANWQIALYLAENEYPVSWLNSVTSAQLGVAIECIGGLFLIIGFLTRYAAFSMLILSLVIQINYLALDSQLFWVALFGWYTIIGSSTLSIDSLWRRGLADSALPLVPQIIVASTWVRRELGPFYLSLLRIWLGVALTGPVLDSSSSALIADWLPFKSVALMPPSLAAAAGILLVLGLGTRYVAAALCLMVSATAMMNGEVFDRSYWLAVLGVLFIHGAGKVSFDSVINWLLLRVLPMLDQQPGFMSEGLPRIVIVGAGFGGIACARALRGVDASVTLIDRSNHHLFQPLLYQVATSALSPSDIASPVRPLFRNADNTFVLLGTVTAIDKDNQTIAMNDQLVPYDYLVLATGAAHSYFGKDQWAPYAPGLKNISDATEIRHKILIAFERAEATGNAEERKALLTFLIVGGGPTGVELAGAIAELARFGMDKEFRNFDPAQARIVLVQSGPRLLPTFPETLSSHAHQSLDTLGVEVRLDSRVEHIDALGVIVNQQRIAACTVLWAAGVTASPAAKWLQTAADRAGRVEVKEDLSVPEHPNVFAIGDTAASNAWRGEAVPGLAPAAKQGGKYVAQVIKARLRGKSLPQPFIYHHMGSLATIGRKAAVADFGGIKLWGAPAWWLWGLIHVGFLVGVRNRMSTMLNWFWTYLTFSGGIRLIVRQDDHATDKVSATTPGLTGNQMAS